jgi:hypothetical protein
MPLAPRSTVRCGPPAGVRIVRLHPACPQQRCGVGFRHLDRAVDGDRAADAGKVLYGAIDCAEGGLATET